MLHQLGIDLGDDRVPQLVLHAQRIDHRTIEPARPGDLAIRPHIDQTDDDPNPIEPVLDRTVQDEVCLQTRSRRSADASPPAIVSGQRLPGTQEIQRNRDRPAEISSASPRASPSSCSRADRAQRGHPQPQRRSVAACADPRRRVDGLILRRRHDRDGGGSDSLPVLACARIRPIRSSVSGEGRPSEFSARTPRQRS